jgi:hypothetical protein
LDRPSRRAAQARDGHDGAREQPGRAAGPAVHCLIGEIKVAEFFDGPDARPHLSPRDADGVVPAHVLAVAGEFTTPRGCVTVICGADGDVLPRLAKLT